MKRSVLIMAGGNINYKFNVLHTKFDSPALLPINNKALSQYIIEFYHSFGYDSIYLVIEKSSELLVSNELFETLRKTNTTLISVEGSNNVNESIKKAITSRPEIQDEDIVTVNIVTTIPQINIQKDQILIDKEEKLNHSWSGFNLNNEQVVINRKSGEKQLMNAFQGVFSVEKKLLAKSTTLSSDLIDLIDELISLGWKPEFVTDKWLDCGHEQNYFNTKSELINSRNFNKLKVDKDQIIKRSSNKAKILSEIGYYNTLPDELKSFFPKLLNYHTEENDAQYIMAYYQFPNLSELSLYWDINPSEYEKLFENLKSILLQFEKYTTIFSLEEYLQFYINKTIKRLNTLESSKSEDENFRRLLNNEELMINGRSYLNFNKLKVRISEKLKTMYLRSDFSIMHGDFCFNNILVDTKDFSVKLIDPRGSFNNDSHTIYGDLKYDIAKLAHSTCFYYDYIVSDLFRLKYSQEEGYTLNFNLRDNHELLVANTQKMIRSFGYSHDDIKLIVGLLFLSMTPLHNDSETRQIAMYLNGIQILNEVNYE